MSTAATWRRRASWVLLAMLVGAFAPAESATAQWTNSFFGSSNSSTRWGRPSGTISRGPSYYYGGTYDGYYFGHGYVGPQVNYAGSAYGGTASSPSYSSYRPSGYGYSYGSNSGYATSNAYRYTRGSYATSPYYGTRTYPSMRYGYGASYSPPRGYPMVGLSR